MGAEVALFEVVEDELGGTVAVEVDFFDDDVFLLLNLAGREGGMEEDVGKELEAAVEVLREGGGIDASLLLGGEGVEFATYAVDAVADVPGAAAFGAFEDGVLDEVGNAFLAPLFVARADTDVYPGVGDDGVGLTEDDADAVV